MTGFFEVASIRSGQSSFDWMMGISHIELEVCILEHGLLGYCPNQYTHLIRTTCNTYEQESLPPCSKRGVKYNGFMHEFWTMLTANMTYTRSQKYTNIVVGPGGIASYILFCKPHAFMG
jgi:hypothetical protein